MATRNQQELKAVHSSADYFEASFRAKLVKAMQQLQRETSINQVALGLHNVRQKTQVIPRSSIEKALAPLKQVLIDAYRRGGALGAKHVEGVLNG